MSSLHDELLVKRYEYVLGRKKDLNEVTFKIVAFFQVLGSAVVGGELLVLDKWQSGSLKQEVAVLATYAFMAIFATLGLACIGTIIAGVASWLDYRADEGAVEAAAGLPARQGAQLGYFYRWFETYVLGGVAIITIAYVCCTMFIVLPLLGAR